MEKKEVRVTCPCCRARLDVDVRTETVLRWREEGPREPAAEEGGPVPGAPEFDALARRVAGRLDTAVDKFDDNLAREKRRGQDLDELFRRASEKLKDGDDEE